MSAINIETVESYLDENDNLPLNPQSTRVVTGNIVGNIFSVARDSLGQDRFMTALGGSLVVDGESITTQLNSTQPFDPLFRVTDFSGSANTMGGTTTHLIVQPNQEGLTLPASIRASYDYTAFDIPVGPISSAKSKYNMYIEQYEEFVLEQPSPELTMLDVYGTVLSMDREGDALNSLATRFSSRRFTIHPGGRELTPAEEENVVDYFKHFTISNPGPSSNYRNLIYPHNSNVEVNSAFTVARESFPFYVGFDIDMASSGDVCSGLVSSGYADKLMTNIAATIENGDLFEREDFVQQRESGLRNFTSRVYESNSLATYDASSFIGQSAVLGLSLIHI